MKVLMVDLDGTLFDTKDVNYHAYREALETYGYKIDYKYYCDYCNGRHYLDFLPQITTKDETVLLNIHNKKKTAYKKYLDHARLNWALVDIIKGLRGEYKTALVTTASKENTYDILNRFGIIDIFDLILTSDDVNLSKPHPEAYFKAMKYFSSDPEKCIIFEDSAAGIEAAEKTGANIFVVKGY